MDFGPRHRRRIWYTAAVAGLAGLAGVTGLAAVMASPRSQADVPAAAAEQPARTPADGDGDGDNDTDGTNGRSYDGPTDSKAYAMAVDVPCDPDELIAALVHANADGGGTLALTAHCRYSLTAHDQTGNGLPIITQPVAIKGNGATIVRSADADDFRILNVGLGGDLTVRDVTVKGGVGTGTGVPSGGGGLLVQPGGKATLVHSRFTRNRSTGVGGAVANFGSTKITGDEGYGQYRPDTDAEQTEEQWSEDANWYSSVDNNSALGVDAGGLVDIGGGGLFNARFLTVENTRISYNNAVGDAAGGGLETADHGVTALTSIRVDHNRSARGGAIAAIDGSTTTLAHSYVTDNTSDGTGGGIDVDQDDEEVPSTLHLLRTLVSRNSASFSGGGIASNGVLVADDSRINENTSALSGGGVANAAIEAVLRHTEVNLNKAIGPMSRAGGVFTIDADVTLVGTELTGNLSVGAPGGVENDSGAAHVDDESTIIRNRPTNCEGSVNPVPNCFG